MTHTLDARSMWRTESGHRYGLPGCWSELEEDGGVLSEVGIDPLWGSY